MSRNKLFAFNTLSTALYHVIAMVIGLITPKIMIRYYGDTLNGVVAVLLEYMSYFKTLEIGLSSAAIFALYKPLADDNKDEISSIVSTAKNFYIRSGMVFIVLVVFLSISYPFFSSATSLDFFTSFALVLVIGVSGTLEFFTLAKYRVLLTADQKIYVISLTSAASLLVSLLFLVFLSPLHLNIILLRFLISICVLIRPLILSRYVKHHYPYVKFNRKSNPKHLSMRWDALYQEVASVLQQGCGIIVSSLTIPNSIFVSIYTTYRSVTVGLWSILKMTTTGLYASFGHVLVSDSIQVFQNIFRDFEFLFISIVTVIYSVAFVTIDSFVSLIASASTNLSDYYKPVWGILLLLEGFFFHCKTPLDICVVAAGQFKNTRNHNTIHLLISFILAFLLGHFWGIIGIISGILLSHIFRVALQLWYVPKNILQTSYKLSLRRIILSLSTILLIALPIRLLISYFPTSLLHWAIFSAGVTIYSIVLTSIIGLIFDRKAFISVLSRATYIFKK